MSEDPTPYTTGTQDSGDEQPARPIAQRTAPGYTQTTYSNHGTHTHAGYTADTARAIRTAPVLSADECAAIARRLGGVAPGPWHWARDYGMADGRHWCLEQPGNREYTVSWALVLMSTHAEGLDGQPFDQHPDLQFVAHARADVPALLRTVAYWCEQATTAVRALDAALARLGTMEAERDAAQAQLATVKRQLAHTSDALAAERRRGAAGQRRRLP